MERQDPAKVGSFILTVHHARLMARVFELAESDPNHAIFAGMVMPHSDGLRRHIRLWKDRRDGLSRRGDRGVAVPGFPCAHCRARVSYDEWGILLHESEDVARLCLSARRRSSR